MIVTNNLEFCFWKPDLPNPPGNVRGVLHVLRRDLVHLYGPEAEIPSGQHHSPMLATIGMLTGVDLMSKLATNDLSGRKVRDVFKNFLVQFGGLTGAEPEALYKLRCAQVHGYCLIDHDENRKVTYLFTLHDELPPADPLLVGRPERTENGLLVKPFDVNYWGLKRFFLKSVENFEEAVRNGRQPLLDAFMKAMNAIGKIQVS